MNTAINLASDRARLNRGFTLIELIIVIVILGILAVTAVPKFIDISSDAEAGVLKNIAGQLKSANDLIYAKSVITGQNNKERDNDSTDEVTGVTVGGTFIATVYGTPWLYSGAAVKNIIDIDILDEGFNDQNKSCEYNGDFCFMIFNSSSAPTVLGLSFSPGAASVIYPKSRSVSDNCYAYHIFDRTDNTAWTGSVTTGC
ncbi:prepilin-type N-terminal cleavage/methylation domain-containing protein [Paraglaciecola aquimarina]|uniref:Prepilin-type N-terminal cleavage/methylation domain-containing protein n=1 Tax=Paraglaciecola aquimarina TaxID=1235557 RepID=A0ABU3SWY9_9ALTE|nr:prepilin-type N-terminal cleavage/methylation domain-containing protein [Paraglaciecola aquimarina]MDU0354515.1 prepilin-type N-terminal cleavage/methylation domain-containing protein [Paraglaciecola aquimarina]